MSGDNIQIVDMKWRPLSPLNEIVANEILRLLPDGKGFASSDIARIRLKMIVKRDREKAQEGRWVWKDQHLSATESLQWIEIRELAKLNGDYLLSDISNRNIKPHYRWQVRR